MASAMRVFRKFRASDGRIKIATLSGVSALVAVIALLVGVLPVMADHDPDPATHPLVDPGEPIRFGGGPGACDFVEVDSAARYELHINNPISGDFTDPETGTTVNIEVTNQTFTFDFGDSGVAAYDVVVNGGPQNLHYDYDGSEVGPVSTDSGLHAPLKNNGDLNNLSHINICYDIEPILFVCSDPEDQHAVKFGDQGLFTDATARIFTLNGAETCNKLGLFFIEDGETTLDFGTGNGEVAGRADFYKQFDSTDDFGPLEYDGGPAEGFEEVPWCSTEGDAHGNDFGVDWDPGIPEYHTACKVFQTEYADATQHTAVYFEFEDPNFR